MTLRIPPVDGADAVRARVPAVLVSHRESVDAGLKELCARYLASDDDVVAQAEDPERYGERERAALAWAHAIAWDADRADVALWEVLHRHFDDPQLVELGYAIAYAMGQQRWVATLGLR